MGSSDQEPQGPSATAPAIATNRRLIALIPYDGQEPPATLPDEEAAGIWAAVSALWHPALLATVDHLPEIENVDQPLTPEAGDVRIVAAGAAGHLPSGYRAQAEDAGAVVVESEADRPALLGSIFRGIGREDPGEADPVALDFLALGTARWWLRDLTIAMGHIDCLDVENLSREALAGARAWQAGDRPAATNRLRAAFELLTQARERFYPVDAYLVDLCLLDPALPASALDAALEARAAFTVLAQAAVFEAWEAQAPQALAALRDAVNEGWVDVVGGAYAEVDEPLRPVESILWQFRKGAGVYRRALDGRTVETLARRRFGLYPQLPQVARRHGFRFALHLGFDAGTFPVPPDAKRLWQGPDGSGLETLTRAPLGADRQGAGLQVPWRLARTMKDDHVATLPLVHWPSPVAGWYLDLRRVAGYSPVLARWTTLGDYFHLTDRPFETFEPALDEYVTPYLDQAVARGDAGPISERPRHARLRARFDALGWLRTLAEALSVSPAAEAEEPLAPEALEEAIETGRLEEAGAALDRQEPAWASALARAVVGDADGGRPGFLVLNPLGVARRAGVLLPGAAADLGPEGPLRAAQGTEGGAWAVVDLPAHGYAWVPLAPVPDAPPAPPGVVGAKGRTLHNEAIAVEVDEKTGGLRGVRGAGEQVARLGQQLLIAGLEGPDGSAATSRMRGEGFRIEAVGPALVQAVSWGTLRHPVDDRALAAFRQRLRLWSGRPILELEITLEDLDPSWLEAIARGPAWDRFLSCRWAWPDPAADLRRTSLLGSVGTTARRPETPDALDISTRRQRTALLFGGLAHQGRHGPRMLDTLLIAGREAARTFTVGVTLDQDDPSAAALDLIRPALVVPTAAGVPRPGPVGWFFQLDHPAVAVTRVSYADPSGEGRGWGVAFHLLETSGRPARCRLRTFRTPVWARQTDFQGELIIDLPIDGDAVRIDLTPHELARIDVTLG